MVEAEGSTHAFETEDENQQCNTGRAMRESSRQTKYKAEAQIDRKNVARLERFERHQHGRKEAIEGIEALADGEEVSCASLATAI
jgi:hypothetical protein